MLGPGQNRNPAAGGKEVRRIHRHDHSPVIAVCEECPRRERTREEAESDKRKRGRNMWSLRRIWIWMNFMLFVESMPINGREKCEGWEVWERRERARERFEEETARKRTQEPVRNTRKEERKTAK